MGLGSFAHRNVPEYVYDSDTYYYSDARRPINIYEAEDALSRAYAAFGDGEYYESILAFDDAQDEKPEDGLIPLARAQAYIAIGDLRNAYDDLVTGMALIPDWTDVDLTLTEIYGIPEDFEDHLAELQTWVRDHPKDVRAHFVLGYVDYFLQEYDLAKGELVYVLAWDEEHEQARILMDAIYERETEKQLQSEGLGDTE